MLPQDLRNRPWNGTFPGNGKAIKAIYQKSRRQRANPFKIPEFKRWT